MSIFDLSAAVALFQNAVLIVARPATDGYGAGGFASAQTLATTTGVGACVQPGPGKNLIKVPEGVRPEDIIQVWSSGYEFQPRDRITIESGVFAITFGGRNFEVFLVDEWTDHGNYSKAWARALGADEPRL